MTVNRNNSLIYCLIIFYIPPPIPSSFGLGMQCTTVDRTFYPLFVDPKSFFAVLFCATTLPLNDTSLRTVWNGLGSWVTCSVIGAYEMSWCQNTHGGVLHLIAKAEHQNRYINDVIKESVRP